MHKVAQKNQLVVNCGKVLTNYYVIPVISSVIMTKKAYNLLFAKLKLLEIVFL